MSRTKGNRRRRTIKRNGPDPIDVHVGHRLREARLLAKLNQIQLGEGIGVTFQAVQKYEAGENRLSASRLYMAAQFVGLPVSFFFEGMGDREAAARGRAFSAKGVKLIGLLRQIDDRALLTTIVQFIRAVGSVTSC
jgi:transcriptional regulator with XRE-family HTH domain